MPDVLSMPTGQIGDPVALFILMIPNDRLLHIVMMLVAREQTKLTGLPFLERQLWPLGRRNIGPVLAFILIKAADKNDVSIEMPKF